MASPDVSSESTSVTAGLHLISHAPSVSVVTLMVLLEDDGQRPMRRINLCDPSQNGASAVLPHRHSASTARGRGSSEPSTSISVTSPRISRGPSGHSEISAGPRAAGGWSYMTVPFYGDVVAASARR